jgi:iron complex outermembrane recepter protein
MSRVAVLLLATALFCGWAFGATMPLTFDIAPGPLQTALQHFSEQTGLQILYDPALTQGRLTQGLKGTLPPEQALAGLLASTDITFSFTAADAVALFRKNAPTAAPTARVTEQAVSPRTVTISANRELADSYNSRAGFTATKVDESPLLVPVTSESLTQAILRDRQANRLEDALDYISATEVAPNGQSALGFVLRGFPTYQYYLDGVRVSPDLNHDGFLDMADIERIEVVKGPASLLYGRTEPGGAINVITKQALDEPHLALEQQLGSFDHKRTQLDAGGPLATTPELLYRFNAAYEDGSSFRGIPNRRLFVAPVLTWKPAEATEATVYGEYLNSHDRNDSGLPVIGDQLPPVPVQRSLETGGEVHTTDVRVGIKGSHTFTDGWIIRLHLDARWTKSPRSPGLELAADGLDPTSCVPTACPVQRELVAIPVSYGHTYFASLDAQWNFSLWWTRHAILIGVDEFQSYEYSELLARSNSTLTTDLFNPRYVPIPIGLLEPDASAQDTVVERWTGLYIQD